MSKADDVRKYVIRREVQPKNAARKAYTKAPKIQRLVTPLVIQRKRHRAALKKKRAAASKEAAAEYAKMLASKMKLERERKEVLKKRRLSSIRLKSTTAAS